MNFRGIAQSSAGVCFALALQNSRLRQKTYTEQRTLLKENFPMGTRVVTTDVEIIAAAIEAFMPLRTSAEMVTEDHVNEAARDVVRKLTMKPEKTSDITGFEEDDG